MRIVIVGGVAGGMSAATRARRMNEQAEIIVLERGGYISFANCGLPYYLAGRIADESSLLLADPKKMAERFRIEARTHHEALSIDRTTKTVSVRDLNTVSSYPLVYDKLILATGASAIIPPIEHIRSENLFVLRSMEDTQQIHAYIAQHHPKNITIIGAGFIGLEMAEAMVERKLAVTVLEKNAQVLPPLDSEMAQPIQTALESHGVCVLLGSGLKSLRASEGKITHVITETGQEVPSDLVLLSIGVRPNVKLAQDCGLTIGTSGGVKVDEYQRTSDENIYAVGDMVELSHGVDGVATRIPLAGPANRQGRLTGEHAATGRSAPAGKAMGTAIVQVFHTNAAMTGLSEKAARQRGIDFDIAYASPNHHAGYYPGAESMQLKLVYEKTTGRLLGAQAVGGLGVDKRIDVAATVLHFGGTIDDLSEIDLAYAPQFGSAKDAIHIASFVARNQREGKMPAVSMADLDGEQLIDVRTPAEFAKGTLIGATNIPLDSLRSRLHELDPARSIVTFCQVGQRGFAAQRILMQNGFDQVRNLKGGYAMAQLVGAARTN